MIDSQFPHTRVDEESIVARAGDEGALGRLPGASRLGREMPARLRPTADLAADAILVGDPGRALALAQTLLVAPKMSNHARGLWGYTGTTHAGAPLSVQATGIGGPSAALVLADLAELGVRRAVRVGTATGLGEAAELGELIVVGAARQWASDLPTLVAESGTGVEVGPAGPVVAPDPALSAALVEALGDDARQGEIASLDVIHPADREPAPTVDAADMQTAALLGTGPRLGVAIAAVVIVAATRAGQLDDAAVLTAAERAGSAAAAALSPSNAQL
jgi:uridine phosphorylase